MFKARIYKLSIVFLFLVGVTGCYPEKAIEASPVGQAAVMAEIPMGKTDQLPEPPALQVPAGER